MRTKFGGAAGRSDVTRSTNADSDAIQPDSQVVTSLSRAATGCPTNAIGSLACAGSTMTSGRSCCKCVRESNSALALCQVALQGKEIDMAVVWQPFCAQGIQDGFAQYPTVDHNKSKEVGGLIAVLAVNRGFMEKNREAVQRLVVAYVDVLKFAQGNQARWAKIYAEKAGLPEAVAAESIRITTLDATLPLESIKRITKFLSDNGVIARDVSGEIAQHYTYDFLARATGKTAAELGLNK